MEWCVTHNCGTASAESLTLEVGVGSLLRAALGPKTKGIPGQPGAITDQAVGLPDFLDHPVKESCWRVSIGSETRPVYRGHGGRVVTLSPPTSEAGVRSLSRPKVGKLVVACRWSAVYSTEP